MLKILGTSKEPLVALAGAALVVAVVATAEAMALAVAVAACRVLEEAEGMPGVSIAASLAARTGISPKTAQTHTRRTRATIAGRSVTSHANARRRRAQEFASNVVRLGTSRAIAPLPGRLVEASGLASQDTACPCASSAQVVLHAQATQPRTTVIGTLSDCGAQTVAHSHYLTWRVQAPALLCLDALHTKPHSTTTSPGLINGRSVSSAIVRSCAGFPRGGNGYFRMTTTWQTAEIT